jgi:hypothetical protein
MLQLGKNATQLRDGNHAQEVALTALLSADCAMLSDDGFTIRSEFIKPKANSSNDVSIPRDEGSTTRWATWSRSVRPDQLFSRNSGLSCRPSGRRPE